MYSTIKRKIGKCIDCTEKGDFREKPLVANRCQHHYDVYRKAINYRKKKDKAKKNGEKVVSVLNHKTFGLADNLQDGIELSKWFKEKMILVSQKPYCQECGKYIPESYYRHAIAHIFPKAQFDSVKTHPLNFLILGAGCGCHDKTHRLDTFSKMKVWSIAVDRALIFKDLITETHKYKDNFFELAAKI